VPAMKVFLFTLVILTQFYLQWGWGAEKPPKLVRLKPEEFAGYYPVYTVITNRNIKLPHGQKRIFSPQRTRQFLLSEWFDTTTKYGTGKGDVVIFENNDPKWHLQAPDDFKHFSAEWVTEDVIKIEVWPGRIIQLIELINVETGEVLYRSATDFFAEIQPPEK